MNWQRILSAANMSGQEEGGLPKTIHKGRKVFLSPLASLPLEAAPTGDLGTSTFKIRINTCSQSKGSEDCLFYCLAGRSV